MFGGPAEVMVRQQGKSEPNAFRNFPNATSVGHDRKPRILRRWQHCEVVMADVSTRETSSLIGSDKVEGTAVYGTDQTKIGTVQRVMIDKISGKVAYAVISFGGFLGVGEDYYPVPWSTLKYDTNLGGYVTGVTADSLKSAPSTA